MFHYTTMKKELSIAFIASQMLTKEVVLGLFSPVRCFVFTFATI